MAEKLVAHTFVLVHGAWHGGWCWLRVADRLRSNGHKVFTPTLTGLGERSHLLRPDIDIGTHITDVVNVIKWERLTDVVLCGHSYGGFVISGVAEMMAEAIRSIVFLDAFVPRDSDTPQSLTPGGHSRRVAARRSQHAGTICGVFWSERGRSRLGGRSVRSAADWDTHPQDCAYRRTGKNRAQNLYPRQELCQSGVRQGLRCGESRPIMAHL